MDLAEQGVNISIGFVWLRITNQMYQSTPTHLLQIQQNCIRCTFWSVTVIMGQLQTTFTGTEDKERVELYPHATSVPSWQVLGRTPPFSLLLNYSNNFIIGVNNRL
jgi:hypothetical protein